MNRSERLGAPGSRDRAWHYRVIPEDLNGEAGDRPAALRPRQPRLDPLLGRPHQLLAPLYDDIDPGTVDDLLNEINDDPTCIFWG